MTKQEKILKGIEQTIKDDSVGYVQLDSNGRARISKAIASYLHSQDVVIKIKCPDCEWSQFAEGEHIGMTPCHSCNSTGYIIESLMEK